MNTIIINGQTYSGQSISISNNQIVIDGKKVTSEALKEKVITISITGNVEKLQVDACETVTVTGEVGSLATLSGDVDVSGSVGSVTTVSGDVECGNVKGHVSTMSGYIRKNN